MHRTQYSNLSLVCCWSIWNSHPGGKNLIESIIIFIKLLKTNLQPTNVHLPHSSSPSCHWWCYPLASVIHMPLQKRLVEFVIVLQYVYLKSCTHQSALLPRKTFMQELKQKCVTLTLRWGGGYLFFLINFSHNWHTSFHIHAR
jgi:hypothetical protein